MAAYTIILLETVVLVKGLDDNPLTTPVAQGAAGRLLSADSIRRMFGGTGRTVKRVFRHRRYKPPTRQQLTMLEDWFDSERGGRLLARESELVDRALAEAFGYYLLQLSVDSRVCLHENCRVQRKYRGHLFDPGVDVQCSSEQLPFASESLDVVILHHVQEFVDDPYQLLREVQRVVVPHGQVLILGFNPWSPLGLYSRVRRFFPESHWHNHLITWRRMNDWLGLLGFETNRVDFGLRLPARIAGGEDSLPDRLARCWPFGNFYLISAVKQVASFTPIKQRWKAGVVGFPSLGAVKPPAVGSRASRRGAKLSVTGGREVA